MTVFSVSSRSLKRAFIATSVMAGVLLAVPALPLHAEPATMSAVDGVFTGTSAADTLSISRSGANLTHNRFAAGDPGFASNTDFDSTVEGVQTKAVADFALTFNLLDGDDVVILEGDLPRKIFGNFDLGAGKDKIHSYQTVEGLELGASSVLEQHMENVEIVVGSSRADAIYAYADNAPRALPFAVYGRMGNDILNATEGNDHIDAGGGDDEIQSHGGNDVVVTQAPWPDAERVVGGGVGYDILVVKGSTGDDALGVVGPAETFWAFDLENPDGGYTAMGFERAQVAMQSGNDLALVSTAVPFTTVAGGPGIDQVLIDALGGTAKVTNSTGGARSFAIPYGNKTPIVALDGSVEKSSLMNETTIATATGPGGGPHVRTFRADGSPVASFYAYAANFTGGVTLAMGDLNGDGDDEIITAAGPGGGPHVRVFYSDGTDTGIGFYAFDPNFNGGVNLAAVDINGDGVDEIVAVPASGGSAYVRLFTGDGQLIAEWEDPSFPGSGFDVARGASTGAYGGDQILISLVTGGSAQVRIYEADGAYGTNLVSIPVYDGSSVGSSVSGGEFAGRNGAVTAPFSDEIITGAGPGGGPHVLVKQNYDSQQLRTIGSFLAYGSSFKGGVEVAACNADGGDDEIVTTPGAGMAPLVRTFKLDGTVARKGFYAYGTNFTNGIDVACGGTMSRTFTNSAAQTVSAQSVTDYSGLVAKALAAKSLTD